MQFEEIIHNEGLREYTVRTQSPFSWIVIDICLFMLIALRLASECFQHAIPSTLASGQMPHPLDTTLFMTATQTRLHIQDVERSIEYWRMLWLWVELFLGKLQSDICRSTVDLWTLSISIWSSTFGLAAFASEMQACMAWLSRSDVSLCILLLVVFRIILKISQVTSESVLVFRDMGIQLQTRFWGGFRSTTRFIPASKILSVIINEGITLWQVKFYLAIVIEGENEMTVAFSRTLPRLHILERVYVNIRSTLMHD
ncbi:hypothetical protein QVD99_001737 [Batrachochytrium dendrobatidis]|nr:hypothetical protein O5D80_000384 [Batrachochytrium dendrobatidis]KAK5671911.1 hypothetical protein QVD99_001737 [Batrachochytrium dendrobatidis]